MPQETIVFPILTSEKDDALNNYLISRLNLTIIGSLKELPITIIDIGI